MVIVLATMACLLFLTVPAGCYDSQANFSIPRPPTMEGVDPEIVAAVDRLVEVITEENVYGQSFLDLAKTYQANGLDSWADQTYDVYLQENPEDAKANFWKGLACMSLGNLEAAKASFENCIRLRPDYPAAHWRLALVQLELGDAQAAMKQVEQAERLSPRDLNIILVRARALLALSQPDEARALLDASDFDRSPNASYARFLKGTAIVQSRNSELQELGKLLLAGKNSRPQWTDPWRSELHQFELGAAGKRIKASRLFQGGKYAEAIKVLQSCLTVPNDDGRDWNLMAVSYLNIGNRAKARETMEKGLEKYPQDLDLNMNLARIYLEDYVENHSASLERAAEMLGRVIEKSPDRWEPYDVLGKLNQLRGNLEESLGYYQMASRLAPANQPCHWNKIFLLLDLGRADEAEKEMAGPAKEQQSAAYEKVAQAELFRLAGKFDASREALSQVDQSLIRDRDLLQRIKALKSKVDTQVPEFELVD